MAISLTGGGIPCQEITATLEGSNWLQNNYSVSLPVGVICSITIPDTSKNWFVNLGGTCMILTRFESTINSAGTEYGVLNSNSFQITTGVSSIGNQTPFLALRLK